MFYPIKNDARGGKLCVFPCRGKNPNDFPKQHSRSSLMILEQARRVMQCSELFDSFVEVVDEPLRFLVNFLVLTHILIRHNGR